MRASLPRWIRGAPAPRVTDAVLAAAFCVYGLGHAWLDWIPDEGYLGGPRGLDTVVVLLTTLPLAARRIAPLATLTVIVGTFALSQVVAHPTASFYSGLVPSLIAAYSVARYEQPRRVLIGIAIGLVAMGTLVATTPPFNTVNELLFETFLWSAAWLLGTTIRKGERRAHDLGRRAQRLEREQEEQARAAVLEERARIARELHDVVAHGVSLMVVQAGGARLLLDGTDGVAERVRSHLAAIEDSGRDALEEMRRLLAMLRDDDELDLEPLPGMDRVDALAESARSAGIDVRIRVEGEPAPLPPGIGLTAYRIAQEALTNVIRHSGAADAELTVRYGPRELELEILDDGRGAPATANGGGHGLVGMRERTALYGGEIEAGNRKGRGYAVRVRLPLTGATS